MEEDLTQQNIENIMRRLNSVFHEADEAKARAALAGLNGMLPESLHERLIRVPDFSALAASLTAHADLLAEYPSAFAVLAALRANRPELLSHAGAEVVAPLVQICQSKAKKISKIAQTALLSLTNPAAQEELCRLATDEELVVAREIALEAGFAPRDAGTRALFLFLTGQWEQYESLDFDAGLMRIAYETADRKLQQFIAKVGREAGRPEIFKIMSGRGNRELNFDEWQAAAHALIQGERWQDAWEMALKAPPTTAALLLKALIRVGWQPVDAGERISFDDLARRVNRLLTATVAFGGDVLLVPESDKVTPSCYHADRSRTIQQTLVTPDLQLQVILYAQRCTVEVWDINGLDIVWAYRNNANRKDKDPYDHYIYRYDSWRMALSASGQHLILMQWTRSSENSIYYRFLVFETLTGQCIQTFYPPPANMASHNYHWCEYVAQPYNTNVVLSSDGRFAAAMFNRQYIFWRIGEDTPIAFERLRFTDGKMIFSPIGSHLLISNHIFRLNPWQMITNIQLEFVNQSLSSFSNDGQLLVFASPSNYGKLTLYDVSERCILRQQQGNFNDVHSVIFSLDKNRIVTGHYQVIRVWDVPSLVLVNTFEAHEVNVAELWFSADGKTLHSYGSDGKLKSWQTPIMERAEIPIEKLTIQDLLDLRKRYAKSPDKAWFAFMDGLVSRRFQHAIELGELDPAVSADEFDIEIE